MNPEELKCPVCLDIMTPPITLCKNSHNICSACKPQLVKCPHCEGALLDVRNLELEAMIISSANTLPSSDCCCPLASTAGVTCPWAGRLEEVKKHVIHTHDNKISHKSGKITMTFTDISSSASYTSIIVTLGEVFMRKAMIRDDVFYLTVMYVGPMKNSSKYKYTFTINKKNSVESISICKRTTSFLENCDDIYRSRNCVKLHYDVICDFLLDNNDLPNVMEISKV